MERSSNTKFFSVVDQKPKPNLNASHPRTRVVRAPPAQMSSWSSTVMGGTNDFMLDRREHLKTDMEAAEATIQELHEQVMAWERQATRFNLEVDTLKQKLNFEKKQGSEMKMEMLALRAESDVLKQELEKLKLEGKGKKSVQCHGKCEVQEARQALEVLEKEISYEKEANLYLTSQLQKTQESYTDLFMVVHELEDSLQKQGLEIGRLTKENGQLTDSIALMEKDLLHREAHFGDELNKLLAQKDEELRQSKEVYEQFKTDASAMHEKLFAAKSECLEKLSEKDKRIEALLQQLEAMETMKTESEELNRDCQELTEENIDLICRLNAANKELENKTSLLVFLERKIGALLGSSIAQTEIVAPMSITISSAQTELSVLLSQLSEIELLLKCPAVSYKQELDEKKMLIVDLEDELEEVRNTCRLLEDRLAERSLDAKAEHKELCLLEPDVAAREEEDRIRISELERQLSQEIDASTLRIQELDQQVNSVEEDKKKLLKEASSLDCERINLEKATRDLEEQVMFLRKALESCALENESLQKSCADKKECTGNLEEQVINLRKELESCVLEKESLEKGCAEGKECVVNLETSVQEKRIAHEDIALQFIEGQLSQENVNLKRENDACQLTRPECMGDRDTFTELNHQMAQELLNMKKELHQCLDEASQHMQARQLLMEELDEQNNEIRLLRQSRRQLRCLVVDMQLTFSHIEELRKVVLDVETDGREDTTGPEVHEQEEGGLLAYSSTNVAQLIDEKGALVDNLVHVQHRKMSGEEAILTNSRDLEDEIEVKGAESHVARTQQQKAQERARLLHRLACIETHLESQNLKVKICPMPPQTGNQVEQSDASSGVEHNEEVENVPQLNEHSLSASSSSISHPQDVPQEDLKLKASIWHLEKYMMERQVEQLQEENIEMKQSMEIMSNQLEELQSMVNSDELRAQELIASNMLIKNLQERLQCAEEENKSAECNLQSLQQDMKGLCLEREELLIQVQECKKSQADLRERYKCMKLEKETIEISLEALSSENARLQEKNMTLIERLISCENQGDQEI